MNREAVVGANRVEGYINKVELCRRLKKGPRTIEKWQRTGVIPFVKIGRTVLYDWEDVDQHLNKHFRVSLHPFEGN